MAEAKSKRKKTRTPDALDAMATEVARLDRESEEARAARPALKLGILNREPETGLGTRLQQAREEKGLTQGELSARTKVADLDGKGLSRAVISLYEAGTNRPGPRELRLLCEVLRITPSFLIYGREDPFGSQEEFRRLGGGAGSEPELFAQLTYCYTRLHPHHRTAVMELMLGLLRGWNKGFDKDLHTESNDVFLAAADELRLLLRRRKEINQPE